MRSQVAMPGENKRHLRKGSRENDATGRDESAPQPAKNAVFTFRLPREELEAIERIAAEANMTMSEFLRKAAAMKPTASILERPQFSLSLVTPYGQSGTLVTWSEGAPATVKIDYVE